ncbi:MAG: NTPase [Microgenomates bacterium 39_7]|nr:MAG: NTPase [Microgenomates bacterium 39_7]
MIVFVGSTNPVKINATKKALSPRFQKNKVIGLSVSSKVGDQPMSDKETRQGAINRATSALSLGVKNLKSEEKKLASSKILLGVGLEGGVTLEEDENKKKMWETVWVAVIDQEGNLYLANGGRFLVPKFLADQILEGAEMGPALSKYFNGRSVKTQEGLVGVMTNKYVDRTQMYTAIVRLAIGQWYGRDWQQQLDISI